MNYHKEKIEKILNKALELKDKGKSPSEILELFPEYKNELKDFFGIIDVFSREKITPSKELLEKIISQIDSNGEVTEKEFNRYSFKGGLKGRPSSINDIKNRQTMAEKWKIFVPIGVLVVVAVLIVGFQLLKKPSETAVSQKGKGITTETPTAQEGEVPKATDNVDDMISALVGDSNAEFSQSSKEADDIELLNFDSQVINDFGQSYNESDF